MSENTSIKPTFDQPRYDVPPPRPAQGSPIATYAWEELNRENLFTAEGDFYGGMTGRAVMDLVSLFAEQDHSGLSASLVADLFRQLVMFEPLGPLTDDPDEWMEVTDGLWQSRRKPSAFSRDGGKTYRDNDEPDTVQTTIAR